MFSVIRKVGFWDSAMPIWVYLGIFSGCGVWFSGFLVCGLVILGLVLSDPTGSGRFRDWLSGLVTGQFGCVCGGRPGQPFPFVFLHPTSRFELFCSVGFLFLQFPLYFRLLLWFSAGVCFCGATAVRTPRYITLSVRQAHW